MGSSRDGREKRGIKTENDKEARRHERKAKSVKGLTREEINKINRGAERK